MKNNKLMVLVLGTLTVIAIAWRIANPPPPIPPGPLGDMSHWQSLTAIGDMGPAAVNPDGTKWAGAWNEKRKDKLNSAVWIIDLEKDTVKKTMLKEGLQAMTLTWKNDSTFQVAAIKPDKRYLYNINADTGKLATAKESDRLTLCYDSHTTSGMAKYVKKTGCKWVAFTGMAPAEPGKFGLLDTLGSTKNTLVSDEIPGRIENMWVSDAGVLLVAVEQDKIHRMMFTAKDNKLIELKDTKVDIAKTWPDAPENMMFVSYTGGYDLDLQTGKVKKLFKFKTSDEAIKSIVLEIGDGRLYPRKGGGYTSVSYTANAVDIRSLKKDGTLDHNILPRK